VLAFVSTSLSGYVSRIMGASEVNAGTGVSPQPCAGYLDMRILNTPLLAIDQARKEIVRMMTVSMYMFADIREILFDFDARRAETIRQHEQVLDSLNHEITVFLAALAHSSNSQEISYEIPGMLQSVSDLEHIGDRCEEILDCIIARKESGVIFSDAAMDDLKRFVDVVCTALNCTGELVISGQYPAECEYGEQKATVRSVFDVIKQTHFDRISSGDCPPRAAILYNEMTAALMRISELCWNITEIQGRKADESQNRSH
jgi:phosphate:Na+ symporter